MYNIKKVLQTLEDEDMCVHVIDHSEGYCGFTQPIATIADSTHFIMKGKDIVHVGSLKSVEKFIWQIITNNYWNKKKKPKCCVFFTPTAEKVRKS